MTAPRRRRGVTLLIAAALAVVLALVLLGGLLAGGGVETVAAPFAHTGNGLVFGADRLGRDVWQRTLRGGIAIVFVPIVISCVVEALGVGIGAFLALGRRGGVSALPLLDAVVIVPAVLVLLTCLYAFGPGIGTLTFAVSLVFVPIVARVARALIRPVLASGYVEAALAAGDSEILVLWHEVLPAVTPQLLTDLGLRYIMTVYLIASTAFLGFAPFGDSIDWASMVQENSSGLSLNVWAALLPLIGITSVTIPLNLLIDRVGVDL